MRQRARVWPCASTTAERESSHSWVSSGSTSGSWCTNPSMIIPSSKPRYRSVMLLIVTIVYTDGACSGNPGPGGWAWAVPDGAFAAGAEVKSTNQRMEIAAAFEAVKANPGQLEVVSDSTYVVNCFRDRWHEGWVKRGWLNSQRKPVANRDLWEPFIALVLE